LPARILVVDNFEPLRRLVRSSLEPHKQLQIVGEAADGLEAVQKAQELKPDLVLLDIGLPNLNGIEAASRIAELVPEAKILLVTQNYDADVLRAALSNGAQGCILKMDSGQELLPALEAVLRGENFVSGRLLSRIEPHGVIALDRAPDL
jgi:DNA-binding NarL/FixJ family response regulator